MRVALNPSTGALELRDEDAAGSTGDAAVWPLDLDAASGALRVCFAGLTISARPLSWREKRVLARHADHGEAFLQRQLIDACCGAGAATAAPAVCWALAAWVNFPAAPASAAVPFASAAVARVTAGLCRTIGLRPAEIDALDALEVEALWRAQSQSAAAANVADGPTGQPAGGAPASVSEFTTSAISSGIGEMRTIRIVADPPNTDDTPAASSPSEAALAGASSSRPATLANRERLSGPPLPRRAARRELAAHLRAVALDETSVAGPTAAQQLAPLLELLPDPLSAPLPDPLANPLSDRLADRSTESSPPAVIPPQPVTTPASVAAPLHLVGSAPTGAARTTAVPVRPSSSGLPTDLPPPATGGDRSGPIDRPSWVQPPAGEGVRPILTPAPPVSAAVQADDRSFDFETLLDTFSERLEQAALEAGVDLEAY